MTLTFWPWSDVTWCHLGGHSLYQVWTGYWIRLTVSKLGRLKFSIDRQLKVPIFTFFMGKGGKFLWTHPHAQYVIIRRSGQGSAFWGLERWNLKFDPVLSIIFHAVLQIQLFSLSSILCSTEEEVSFERHRFDDTYVGFYALTVHRCDAIFYCATTWPAASASSALLQLSKCELQPTTVQSRCRSVNDVCSERLEMREDR